MTEPHEERIESSEVNLAEEKIEPIKSADSGLQVDENIRSSEQDKDTTSHAVQGFIFGALPFLVSIVLFFVFF